MKQEVSGTHPMTMWLLHSAAFLVCFLVLFIIRMENRQLFHAVAELISIIIAFGIFMLIWPARRLLTNDMLVFLGFVYLVVGSLDLAHTLSYKGMGLISPDSANPATQLWIIARYIEAASLLLAPVFLTRKVPRIPAFIVSLVIISGALFSVFIGDFFPDCFIEGSGLTTFKIASEYIIIAIVLLAVFRLYGVRNRINRHMYLYMMVSMIFTILAELSFTLYTDVFDIFNVLGHGMKIISFYYIYKALIEVGLTNPLDVLFADLSDQKERLRLKNEHLEEEIDKRTKREAHLRRISGDIGEAKQQVEEHLRKLKDERNRLVAELSAAALKKSDIVQNNARLIRELQNCNYEKEIIHEQLNYYLRIVEQSGRDIGKMIE